MRSLWTAMTVEQEAYCALYGFHGEGFTEGKDADGVLGGQDLSRGGERFPVAGGVHAGHHPGEGAEGLPDGVPGGRDHRRGGGLLVCGAPYGHVCGGFLTGRQGAASEPFPCPRGRPEGRPEGRQEPASREPTLTPPSSAQNRPSSAQTPTLTLQGRSLTPVLARSMQGRCCEALHMPK